MDECFHGETYYNYLNGKVSIEERDIKYLEDLANQSDRMAVIAK